MANMSYCRFGNTERDLYDCYIANEMYVPENLSEEEKKARKRLIELCITIAREFDYELEEDYS
jgi:hypothetical protein